MAKNIFIPAKEALRRYGKDLRTLKAWARKGEILFQVIGSARQEWYFESPEARYERLLGIV